MGSEKACAFLSHTAKDSSVGIWNCLTGSEEILPLAPAYCVAEVLSATSELFLPSVAELNFYYIYCLCFVLCGALRTTCRSRLSPASVWFQGLNPGHQF